jgi:EAL domain-containing protein (putative c-di-GMP-specific phosphodiesterase class I)
VDTSTDRGKSGLHPSAWAKLASAKLRVLVVDDELALTRSLARVLASHGFAVVPVGDGAAAIAALQTGRFDVVLSDIRMPTMDGVELLRALHGIDPDLPVILMTADPRVETAAQAVELGALQYLLKPVPVDELVSSIRRAVDRSEQARRQREALELLREDPVVAGRAELGLHFDRCLATLWIAFQPIVWATDGRLFGYEALLRSTEPTLPHPGAVLDAAEKLQRVHELGRRVRELCAEAFAPLHDAAGADDRAPLLFVNLHTRDLLDPTLASPTEPLSRLADRVVLEVTERAAMDDVGDVRSRIAALRAMGYRIALDDLGAGYAGLTSFALLEPEFVKLDMSLVRDVDRSPLKQKLIGSMTSLCKDMGMRVVAEGIETVDERSPLVELGCDLLQGYLFARPGRAFPTHVWP